ncbi:MAG: flagellar motor protein MotB [Thermoleophilia bacterium]
MGKRHKKEHHEEHADERWLVTYADMLTLMFVLFMVLFSISVVNTGKFEQLKESLSKAFSPGIFTGGPRVLQQGPETAKPSPIVDTPPGIADPQISGPTGISLSSTGASTEQALESSQLQRAKESIDKAAEKAGVKDQVQTFVNERGLTIRLNTDPYLFDPGSAVLHPEAKRLLVPITKMLKGMTNPIRVEGHTDSTPISTAQMPNNTMLGAWRANAVLQVLWQNGFPQNKGYIASYGATAPVADNDTALNRAKNRRVEILVMRLQGAPSQSAADALGG